MAGPTLTATLEAKLDQYKQQMSEAGDVAEKAVSKIEETFKQSNPQLGGGLSGLLTGLAGGAAIGGLIKALTDANKAMEDLENNAKLVGLTIEQFQADRFAAEIKGLSSDDFTKGVTEMATRLNDASRAENDLTKLLDANNIKWKDQNGQVIGINQALQAAGNLIQNAATELDKIKIADMLGLSKEWVPVLEQGGDAFKKLADSATAAGAVIDAETVQKAAQFQREWDASSAQWKAQMSASLAGFLPLLDSLIDKAAKFASTSGVTDSVVKTAAAYDELGQRLDRVVQELKAADDSVASQQKAWAALKDLLIGSDEWFKYGDQAEAQTAKAVSAMEILKQSFALFSSAAAVQSKIFGGDAFDRSGERTKIPGSDDKDTADAFSRAQDTVKRRTADYIAEAQAVGLDADAKAKLKAQADLNSAADRAGITLTDAQKEEIKQLADAYGQAAQKAADAKQAFQASNQALQFAGDSVIGVLDGLRTGSLTAAQAVNQLTNQLITALEKAVLLGQGPLAGILGFSAAAGSGGTGGLLGGLFGLSGAAKGVGASSGILEGPAALGLSTFASGTDSAPGGLALVGERGPELVNLPKGASVTPNDALRSLSGDSSNGSTGMNVNISIDLKGANGDEAIKSIVRQGVAAGMAQAVAVATAAVPSRQMQFNRLGV